MRDEVTERSKELVLRKEQQADEMRMIEEELNQMRKTAKLDMERLIQIEVDKNIEEEIHKDIRRQQEGFGDWS